MKINKNYDGIPEQEDYQLLPDGDYMFEIIEKEDTQSSAGETMINITLRCMEDGEFEGCKIWDRILFPDVDSPNKKIIGRSKRFLHAINEPFQGEFEVDTDDWINKTVLAKIGEDEYKGRKKNIVTRYLLTETQQNSTPGYSKTPSNNVDEDEDEDLPF